jgi:hypothetical protein
MRCHGRRDDGRLRLLVGCVSRAGMIGRQALTHFSKPPA